MLRRRLPALVAVLVTLVGSRVTMAAPVESTAVVRAMTCCGEHCGGPAGPEGAARCCQVRRGATDPFRLAPPPGTQCGAAPVVLHTDPTVALGSTRPGPVVDGRAPVPSVGRLYLRALSLRL